MQNQTIEGTRSTQRFRLLSARELRQQPPIRWLVKGVLPQVGVAALYGPSASGKSFLCIDLALAIAGNQQTWFGHRVKATQVVYVCLEGAAGLRNRLAAWEAQHGMTMPQDLYFLAPASFSLLNTEDVQELSRSIREQAGPGVVVVIDTLAQAAPGMDENSGAAMSQVLSAARYLQVTTGGLILLVHHTGKDASRGLRGHSSLFAALDAVVEVVREGTLRHWRIAKAKDGLDGRECAFQLHSVEIGEDEDGESVTSCVVRPEEKSAAGSRGIWQPQGGNQQVAYQALRDALLISQHTGEGAAPDGTPCIRLEQAIEETRQRLTCEDKRRKERAKEAIDSLISSGRVHCQNGWLCLG